MARKINVKEITPEVVEQKMEETVVTKKVAKPAKFGVVVDCSELNVRKEPSTDNVAICQIKAGTEVEITEDLGEWFKVKLSNGTVGFCMKQFIKWEIRDGQYTEFN